MNESVDGPLLFLGDGDFSFSVAFRKKFPDADITSSCLLTKEELYKTHKSAEDNVKLLEDIGVKVKFEVDATKLGENENISKYPFRRIIFNFPHVGGKSNIKKNRELLKRFFASVGAILRPDGDVCVTLCQGQGGTPADKPIREWHDSWQVVAMAAYSDFILNKVVPFRTSDYIEYSSTGFRSLDRHFYTEGSLTHLFHYHPCPTTFPKAITVQPGVITYNDTFYSTSSYIANKYKRQLLQDPYHPLSRVQQKLLEKFKSIHDLKQFRTSPVAERRGGQDEIILTSIETGGNGEESDKKLLTSVLENVIDNESSEVNPLKLYSGDVYRHQSEYDMYDLPAQHELGGLFSGYGESDIPDLLKTLSDTILSVIDDSSKQVLMTKNTSIPRIYEEFFDKDFSFTVEVTFSSANDFTTHSCNQVCARGKPDPQRKLNKVTKLSRQVGFCGRANSDTLGERFKGKFLFVIVLDQLTMVKYDIPDARILWSENPRFRQAYTSVGPKEDYMFSPLCVFPPLWRHDLSFWEKENEEFDEKRLHNLIREITGDVIKFVLLQSVWPEPNNSGRISRCYRQVYQSYDVPISHSRAHDFQNSIRLTVAKEMGVILR